MSDVSIVNNCMMSKFIAAQVMNIRTVCTGSTLFEPHPDKTNKMTLRPAKTQNSLGIRPVWSESSLSAWRKTRSLVTHWAHSEDSDQTGWMPRLIWVFAGCTVILLLLSRCGSFSFDYTKAKRTARRVLEAPMLGCYGLPRLKKPQVTTLDGPTLPCHMTMPEIQPGLQVWVIPPHYPVAVFHKMCYGFLWQFSGPYPNFIKKVVQGILLRDCIS